MPSKSSNPLVATTAGALAGGLEVLTIWPMEMIKTNMQLGTMRAHYTGMFAGFRYHIREGGALSLYRGMAPVLVGAIPKAGIRFGAFDYIKRLLADEDGNTTASRNLAAGVAAGAIEATLMTTPVGASRGFWWRSRSWTDEFLSCGADRDAQDQADRRQCRRLGGHQDDPREGGRARHLPGSVCDHPEAGTRCVLSVVTPFDATPTNAGCLLISVEQPRTAVPLV
jgi:hypothetical protein